jgi:anti-sigma regulatory factor (Ser/Thr protein kinase)
MKELQVEALVGNLDAVMDFVSAELETADCGIKAQTQIAIAVEEVFVNIANYAYPAATGQVTIQIEVGEAALIRFSDNGVPYNPLEKSDPDITKSVDEREIGGLGILMVKKIMDAVEYQYRDGRNILTLTRKIN